MNPGFLFASFWHILTEGNNCPANCTQATVNFTANANGGRRPQAAATSITAHHQGECGAGVGLDARSLAWVSEKRKAEPCDPAFLSNRLCCWSRWSFTLNA